MKRLLTCLNCTNKWWEPGNSEFQTQTFGQMAGNVWKLLLEGKNGQFHSIKQPKLGKSWAKASNILKFTFYHLFLYTSCPSSLTWSAKLFIATKARGLQWHIYFMIIVPKAYWQNHSRLHTMIQFSSICMHACPTRTTYWGN